MSDTTLELIRRINDIERRYSRTEVLETPPGGGRDILTANRTYYVRTDGNDSNTGLANTANDAWLTPQHGLDVIGGLDFSIYDVLLQLPDTTYITTLEVKAWIGSGGLTIQGNMGTPANCLISVTGGHCIANTTSPLTGILTVQGVETRTITSGNCILASVPGKIQFNTVRFGACAWHHIQAAGGGIEVTANGNYTISGSTGLSHADVSSGAVIRVESVTVTLSGTPAWGVSFCTSWRSGNGLFGFSTFSGAATGKRYSVYENGVIDTFGSGEAFLPGNALGTVSSGGKYDNQVTVARNTAQFDKANTTLANITGLSLTLLAGRTYKFNAVLYTTSNVASGVKFAIAGTATATAIIYESIITQGGAVITPGTSRATALATTVANVTAVTVATVRIFGTITVNAAGTLTVQFADNAGTNTSSVLVGSEFSVEDITL